jgi:autotransporter-associated beta strand protein
VKSGSATQILTAPQAYSGNTTVTAGTLRIDHPYLADGSTLSIATGAKLQLNFSAASPDTVATLTLGGTPMPPGSYSATSHPAFFTGSGSIIVPVTFDNWMHQFPGLSATEKFPAADPDGDGSDNFTEFAFGGDPTRPSSQGRRIVQLLDTRDDAVSARDLTLTVEVRAGAILSADGPDLVASIDGVAYRFEGSTDLATFTSPVSEVVPHRGPATPTPGYTFKTIRLDASTGLHTKGFLRATASATAP